MGWAQWQQDPLLRVAERAFNEENLNSSFKFEDSLSLSNELPSSNV